MRSLAVPVAAAIALTTAAFADDTKDAARAAVPKLEGAIVKVSVEAKFVLSSGTSTPELPHRVEVTGTVVDASGLTLACASAVDPALLARRVLPRLGVGMPGGAETRISSLKIVRADGSAIDAEVAAVDSALDLAVVRPLHAPTKPLPAVSLSNARKGAPALLEEVFALGRLGPESGRAVRVSLRTVQAVVPGRLYVCDNETSLTDLGSLAWDAQGAVVGIFVLELIERIDGDFGVLNVLGVGAPRRAIAVLRPIEAVMPLIERARSPLRR